MNDQIDGEERISSVTIVFEDLSRNCDSLRFSRASPKNMRRIFQDFVNNSQKLTAYMRREFKARTGVNWEANDFSGWNVVTDLFKELRNIDEHEEPIVLRINYTWTFNNLGPNGDLTTKIVGYWDWDSSFDDIPFDALVASAPDSSAKGKMINITPASVDHEYTLANGQSKIRQLIGEIGYADIIELSKECLKVLGDYHDYYKSILDGTIN